MFQFDEKSVAGLVISAEDCRKVAGTIFSDKIHPENKKQCIAAAEEALVEEIPFLPLSKYLLYSQTDNRTIYEKIYFRRRDMLLALLAGELAEGKKGKYIEKIMDVMWAILEEETWVIPAHNRSPLEINVPFEFTDINVLDLFSAATGATVAMVYHYLHEDFESVIPRYFNEKILLELDRRIIKPFISDYPLSWKGLTGWYVNNWNPWISSNALTVALVAVEELELRRKIVERACLYMNNYFHFTFEDGACIEGVNYYFASNAVIFDVSQILYDITGGKCNFNGEEYFKKLTEYITYMYAGNGCFFTVSDYGRNAKSQKGDLHFLKRMGNAMQSQRLSALANVIQRECEGEPKVRFDFAQYHSYRFIRNLSVAIKNAEEMNMPLGDTYLESTQQMVVRDKNFTLFSKAANNHEPHGHNDSGEFLVYYKNKPLFVDPGIEAYKGCTFGSDREKLWTVCSVWHNTPILNGFEQKGGKHGDFAGQYHTTDVQCDLAERKMSMQLKGVYPDDNGILSAVRTTGLKYGAITVTDDYSFNQTGEYVFNLISVIKPEIENGRLVFCCDGDKIICQFNPNYAVAIEERFLDDQQMRGIWNQDYLYRIIFTEFAKGGSFTLKIEENGSAE